VPDKYDIVASKIGALKIGHTEQNGDFLKKGSDDFNLIPVIFGDHLSK
jgi:hypothetical protein